MFLRAEARLDILTWTTRPPEEDGARMKAYSLLFLILLSFLAAESLVTSLVSNWKFTAGLPVTGTYNFGFSLEKLSGLNSVLRKCNGTDLHFDGSVSSVRPHPEPIVYTYYDMSEDAIVAVTTQVGQLTFLMQAQHDQSIEMRNREIATSTRSSASAAQSASRPLSDEMDKTWQAREFHTDENKV